jgi:hypothetical protein
MSGMEFIDFWKDNPFRELDLDLPPVPTGEQIATKIRARGAPIRQELDALNGHTDAESQARTKTLEAEKARLDEVRKELVKRSDEMRKTLAFDTLLSVQSPAPRLFGSPAMRCAAGAALWRECGGSGRELPLSDTDRDDFDSDIHPCDPLDEHSPPLTAARDPKGAKSK